MEGSTVNTVPQYSPLIARLPAPLVVVFILQLNELLEEQEKNRRERKARMVSGADLISALRQQRRELESKCTSASTRLRKIREETGFLWVRDESCFFLLSRAVC